MNKSEKSIQLDRMDLKILELLQNDGRITNQELAEKINLSPTACLRRVKHLEEQKIISGYCAQINQHKLGYSLIVFVEISLSGESASIMEDFETAVNRVDEICECYLISGETDYKLKLIACDLYDYERIHRQVLANLPHVVKIKSSFSIRTIVQKSNISLQQKNYSQQLF